MSLTYRLLTLLGTLELMQRKHCLRGLILNTQSRQTWLSMPEDGVHPTSNFTPPNGRQRCDDGSASPSYSQQRGSLY